MCASLGSAEPGMVFLDWMSEQDKVGVGVLAKRTVSWSVSISVCVPPSFPRLPPPPLLRCKLAPYPMCVIGISPFPLAFPLALFERFWCILSTEGLLDLLHHWYPLEHPSHHCPDGSEGRPNARSPLPSPADGHFFPSGVCHCLPSSPNLSSSHAAHTA